ncbi:Leucine-rich repeat-containing protein 59 [Sciurus carolinensis]|uniref:Leucine-rich repeat-containing protein 59 n=1 Tax=Sciurus carolinensis TaxID=30640 RepID=A0AA41NGH3_SCICA|nr:Leucine-rich repeat-containing protein 59 [Sciurus carolinensis]
MREQEKESKKKAHQAPKSKFGSHPSNSPVETHLVLGCAEAAAVTFSAMCGRWTGCLWRDSSAAPPLPSVNTIHDNAVQGLCCQEILHGFCTQTLSSELVLCNC